MTRFLEPMKTRLPSLAASLRGREEGQGTTEYVVLIVGVIAIATAVTGVLQTQLVAKLTSMISGI